LLKTERKEKIDLLAKHNLVHNGGSFKEKWCSHFQFCLPRKWKEQVTLYLWYLFGKEHGLTFQKADLAKNTD